MYQTMAQMIPTTVIAMNMILQPKSATRYAVIGAPITEESGMATKA